MKILVKMVDNTTFSPVNKETEREKLVKKKIEKFLSISFFFWEKLLLVKKNLMINNI